MTRRLLPRPLLWAASTTIAAVIIATWSFFAADDPDRSPAWIAGDLASSLVLAGVVVGVVFLVSNGVRRAKRNAALFALGAGLAVAVYGVLREWLQPSDVTTIARVARFASAVLGGYVLATLLDPLYRRVVHRSLTGRGGRSFLPIALGGALLASAAVLVAVLRPAGGDDALLRDPPRPVKRLWLIGVDGVDQRGLAYWVALNSQSALARVALSGASAYVSWDAGRSRGWNTLLRGEPWPQEATVDPLASGESDLARGVRAALPIPRPAPASGGERPSLFDLADRGGLPAAALGFSGDFSGAVSSLPDSAAAHARAVLEGARRGPVSGLWAGRRLDWARRPWEEWRNGAHVSEEERSVLDRSEGLGVDDGGLWRDRFFLAAARHTITRGEHELLAVNLRFANELEAAKDVSDLHGPERVREAVNGYLDLLDPFVADALGALRAGDLLVLLFTPAPSKFGEGQGATGTGVALLFGEKIRAQSAEGETVTTPDLMQTLTYLLGFARSRELQGEVVWDLLVPGLQESFEPITVARYGP